MADGKVTIQALLDASDVQKGIGNIDKSTESLGSKLSAKAVAIGNVISSVVQSAWGQVSKFFGDAMTSTDTLKKYQKSMSYVGFSPEVIDKSSAAMKKYADETVYDLNTIVQTTSILASNGVENFEGMTESLGNLNAALGGSAESFDATSLALTQIVGAGKLASGDWRQFVSNLPASSQLLQDTLAQIGAYDPAMMNFSEALSKGEISSDEFLAAIQKLGSDPSAAEAARSTDTFEGAIGNLQASIEDGLMKVIDHFGMDNITGAINTCTDIISGAGDVFAGLGDVLGDIFDGATDAGGALSDFAGDVQDAITYISQFKDYLEPLGVLIAGLAVGFGILGNAVGLFSIKQGIANVLMPIATAVTGAWATVTTLAADAMAALNLAMEANPLGVIIGVIAAVVAALVYFFTQTETGRQLWSQFVEFLKQAWDAISSAAAEVWNMIVTTVSGAWDAIVSTTSSIWNSITSTLSSVWDGIVTAVSDFVNTVVDIATGIWDTIVSAVQVGFDTVKNAITVGIMLIFEIFNFLGELLLAPFTFIWVNFGGIITDAWNGFCQLVSDGIQAIANVISTIGAAITTAWDFIWQPISSFFTQIWDFFYNLTMERIQQIADIINIVGAAISAAWSFVWGAISNFFSTVWNTIYTTVSTIITNVSNTISNVVGSIVGYWQARWAEIQAAAQFVWNLISAAVTAGINAAKTSITNTMNSIMSFWSGVWNGISSTVSNIWNTIKSVVTGAVGGVFNAVSSTFNNVKSTISNTLDGAKNIVSNAINAIKGFFNFNWSLPPLKLPHITIEGSFSLTPPSVPHFGISWYAKGGLFNGPSVIGVGEAGTEYALPLNKRTLSPLSAGIAEYMDGQIASDRVEQLLFLILQQLKSGATFNLNEREFARLVWKVQQ